MEPETYGSGSESDFSIVSKSTEPSWHTSDKEFISSSTSDEEAREDITLDEIVDFITEEYACSVEVCVFDFLLRIKDELMRRSVCVCQECV